ncbi:MAG: hypothetical protein ABSF71_32760 [Terriglobia bacterium]|jgi:hypothetical protein
MIPVAGRGIALCGRRKIIAASGAFGGGFLNVAKLVGANTALAKPVDSEQLISTIRDLLG